MQLKRLFTRRPLLNPSFQTWADISRCASYGCPTRIEVNDKNGIATISFDRPPANTLNTEMMKSLCSSVREIEQNKCRGIILTSASNTIFTAGLDLKEMYQPDVKRLKEFYTTFQDSWLTLFSTGVPTAALINGHSPAGGCVYSTCCEYRVMLPNFSIGLNEAQFGMVAPKFVRDTFSNVVKKRIAEMALCRGQMFTSEEAFNAGLVDELAPTKEVAYDKCVKFLLSFTTVEAKARARTKRQFRGEIIKEFMAERQQDLDWFVGYMTSEEMQAKLKVYIDELKRRKKQN